MKKRFAALFFSLLLCGTVLTGCGSSSESGNETESETEDTALETESGTEAADQNSRTLTETISDTTVSGWHIVVEGIEISPSLENVSVDLGYSGVETSDFVKEAEDGTVFCLLKLLIEKDGSTEVIDWDSLSLTDADGNTYTRIEDEFITDLGMMRMSGTTLNFGSNEGWIAFAIAEDATGLELSYPFEEETYRCVLPDLQ